MVRLLTSQAEARVSGDTPGPVARPYLPPTCALPGLLLTVVILLVGSTPRAHAGNRSPWTPAHDDVVLQHVPRTTDPRVRRFDALRGKLRKSPQDLQLAAKLADAYIDYGRSTGDARFVGRAMAVIKPWLNKEPVPLPVLLIDATIKQNRHHFMAARAELRQIVKRNPGNAQAWLTLATVAMVQGDMQAANGACVQLAATGGNFMGTVCTASLRALTGHNHQAMALLQLVRDPGPRAPANIKAWIEGLMADVAVRMGNSKAAEQHFAAALQAAPGDNFLLADYADFLLAEGRAAEAAKLVRPYVQSDTSFLRLVQAEKALGDPAASRDAGKMQARFEAMDARGSHVYRREQAGFVLHILGKPQQALKLAQQNWTVQRAPKDVLVYLQAALAANDPQAARPALDFVERTGLDDVRIKPLLATLQSRLDTAARATTGATEKTP